RRVDDSRGRQHRLEHIGLDDRRRIDPRRGDAVMDDRRHAPAVGLMPSKRAEAPSARADWRHCLPTLTGSRVMLRPMRMADAHSLFTMLSGEDVTRFISPPPPTVDGFERFVIATNRER